MNRATRDMPTITPETHGSNNAGTDSLIQSSTETVHQEQPLTQSRSRKRPTRPSGTANKTSLEAATGAGTEISQDSGARSEPGTYDRANFPTFEYYYTFPDIALAVHEGNFPTAYDHYAVCGRAEIEAKLRQNPFEIANLSDFKSFKYYLSTFCEELYLSTNPDVRQDIESGRYRSGFHHWLYLGRKQLQTGERPSLPKDEFYLDQTVYDVSDIGPVCRDFDAETYLYLNPDVRAAVSDDLSAAQEHWISAGRFEGRFGPGARPYATWGCALPEVFNRPFGFNIYGPFAATSGLGTAARNLAKAIKSANIPFTLRSFDVSRGRPRVSREEAETPPEYRINLILANADQLESLAKCYPDGQFSNAYNIAVWAWELASFRADWFSCFAALDEVWTNSRFELDSIASIAPVPVERFPIPVDVYGLDGAETRKVFGIPPDVFVFIMAFDVGSTAARKNPFMVIDAFKRSFAEQDKAWLVVKYHSRQPDPALLRKLNAGLKNTTNILVIAEALNDYEMSMLQASCDCLVSAHRSEGYGLNIAEFLALGKSVVATGYSGNMDFFDESVGYPVDYRLVEITEQAGPYYPGYIWAEPSISSLSEQMLAAFEKREEAAGRAAAGKERIEEHLSIKAVGAKIERHIRDLGLDAPAPKFLNHIGRSRQLANPAVIAPLSPHSRDQLARLENQRPTLSIVLPVYNVPAPYLTECINSVKGQTYPFWELCIADDASTRPETLAVLEHLKGQDPRIKFRRLEQNRGISGASNAAAEMATGLFLVMLDNDDILAPNALLEVADALNDNPEIDALYTDEIKIDADGRVTDHFYKPDWSPEHLESVMYVLHMLTIRKSLFLELCGFRDQYSGAQDYDLILRASRRTSRIHHIDKPLYYWRAIPGSAAAEVDAKPYALQAGRRALDEHAKAKFGDEAWADEGKLPGTFRLRRPIRGTPPVSLLILTNNTEADIEGRGRIRMVDNLVRSIKQRTAYPNYKVIVIDQGQTVDDQRALYAELGVELVTYENPYERFNYADKANFSVKAARTDHIVLLNDDMEVINDEWLSSLLEFSQDPEIGVVGGKLYHSDGSIQHAGTVIGVNNGSTHIYHSYPGDTIGYNGFTHIVRNYSAMTAAAIATRKSVVAQVGGFDRSFPVDYNDVDFCLKVVEAGYRIVYTPFSEMYHFESKSMVRSAAAEEERKAFLERWKKYADRDPHYNVNLTRNSMDFALRS
jgi:GT2 family glycosyltransferase/glycosyltransferase involved in cell wall biosynthesis